MYKFKYLITKILSGGKVWTHNIIIQANSQFQALAIVEEMFPYPEYECAFVGYVS